MRTHAVLVMGLYELLGIPTTQFIEPPGFGKFKKNLCSSKLSKFRKISSAAGLDIIYLWIPSYLGIYGNIVVDQEGENGGQLTYIWYTDIMSFI